MMVPQPAWAVGQTMVVLIRSLAVIELSMVLESQWQVH